MIWPAFAREHVRPPSGWPNGTRSCGLRTRSAQRRASAGSMGRWRANGVRHCGKNALILAPYVLADVAGLRSSRRPSALAVLPAPPPAEGDLLQNVGICTQAMSGSANLEETPWTTPCRRETPTTTMMTTRTTIPITTKSRSQRSSENRMSSLYAGLEMPKARCDVPRCATVAIATRAAHAAAIRLPDSWEIHGCSCLRIGGRRGAQRLDAVHGSSARHRAHRAAWQVVRVGAGTLRPARAKRSTWQAEPGHRRHSGSTSP
jgi:hypothetical protein